MAATRGTSKAEADKTRTTSAPAEVEEPKSGDAADDSSDDDGKIEVTLSNPIIDEATQKRLGLRLRPNGYQVGSDIRVTRDDARALTTAGYTTVDPEDKAAVARMLGR